MGMATVGSLQREVGDRLGRGESFSSVQSDVIEPSGLSEEQKAAVWLYGWSYLEQGRRRYEQRQSDVRRRARGDGAHPSGD
jgi:hypothetical protein